MASDIVPIEEDDGLTARQRAFCDAYCGEARFNAIAACRIAGYADSSYGSLAVQGARLLNNANVRARLQKLLAAHRLTRDVILAELATIALSPMDRFQQIVSEYKSKDGHITYQTIRQDLNPKVKALELAGKAEGMFRDQIDLNVRETRTIVGINISDVTGRHREIDSTATETTEQEQEQEQE